MKLALIPPISLLEYTDETSMQLMLPHLIESDVYTYVYKKHCEDPDQFVILDNGVAEEEVTNWNKLMAIAVDFDVDEIVVPDVMGDWEQTIEQAQEWFDDGYADPTYTYMFVAQGRTMRDFKISIDWALQQDWINTIGLPRHAPTTTTIPSIRHKLACYINDNERGRWVHLLGGAPSLPEELRYYNWPMCVRSTDTSSPFNFAHSGFSLHGGHVTVKRPDDYFDLPATDFPLELTDNNVRLLMEWTGNDL